MGTVSALGNRSPESGDLEGKWELSATARFEGLFGAGSRFDDCSAAWHTALLVELMAVVHLGHVCGCWTHSARTLDP